MWKRAFFKKHSGLALKFGRKLILSKKNFSFDFFFLPLLLTVIERTVFFTLL